MMVKQRNTHAVFWTLLMAHVLIHAFHLIFTWIVPEKELHKVWLFSFQNKKQHKNTYYGCMFVTLSSEQKQLLSERVGYVKKQWFKQFRSYLWNHVRKYIVVVSSCPLLWIFACCYLFKQNTSLKLKSWLYISEYFSIIIIIKHFFVDFIGC